MLEVVMMVLLLNLCLRFVGVAFCYTYQGITIRACDLACNCDLGDLTWMNRNSLAESTAFYIRPKMLLILTNHEICKVDFCGIISSFM